MTIKHVDLLTLCADHHVLFNSSVLTITRSLQQGRGLLISPAYHDACAIAVDIVDLVIDQAIASSSGQGPEQLKGLWSGLQRIVERAHHPFFLFSY
jgi:hypothetical protein